MKLNKKIIALQNKDWNFCSVWKLQGYLRSWQQWKNWWSTSKSNVFFFLLGISFPSLVEFQNIMFGDMYYSNFSDFDVNLAYNFNSNI